MAGGKTWERQLFHPNKTFSLIAMECISELECWAGGGEMSRNFVGHIFHTKDGELFVAL